MFGFGHSKKQSQPAASDGVLARGADELAQQLIRAGIDGVGPFASAKDVAQKAASEHGSVPEAIDAVVSSHLRLVGVNGFLTNLGGFVTMPVAMPANVVGFYTLATRMVAAIAHLSGRDVDDPATRSAVLLDLIGTDATKVLGNLGAFTGGGMTASVATRKLPPAALAAVNKAVAFRIGGRLGQNALSRLPRAIPAAGGVIGAGLDVMLLRKIAQAARNDFQGGAA